MENVEIQEIESNDLSEHRVSEPPQGWRRFLALGPGLVWAASAVGVGSLVFSTRAGAIFGLTLLWAPILTIFIKFFMTELVGRYTLATGENALSAFGRVEVKIGPLKLPRGWIIWIFWVFFIVSVVGMSGISLAVGSSLHGLFPQLSYVAWAIIALASVALVLLGGSYNALEWISRIMVGLIVFFIFYAVFKKPPPMAEVATGLIPTVPAQSLRELVPLLGWAGAGAIGTVWFSLWTQGSGRGAAGISTEPAPRDTERIKGWIKIGQIDLAVNTVITALLTVGFLVAGYTILHPESLVPKGEEMGTVLARIAGVFFGRQGEIIFLVGVFGTLYSTLVANIDGLARVASSALGFHRGEKRVKNTPYRIFLIIYLALAALFATMIPAPVILLQLTAVIDTALLPIVACLSVYICTHFLSEEFRPNRFTVIMAYCSAAFFVFFIILLATAVIRGVQFSL